MWAKFMYRIALRSKGREAVSQARFATRKLAEAAVKALPLKSGDMANVVKDGYVPHKDGVPSRRKDALGSSWRKHFAPAESWHKPPDWL